MAGAAAVNGVVKRAYPLRSLGASGGYPEQVAGGLMDPFSPGAGPCGQAATQVVTVVVENPPRKSFQTSIVFFYDAWASKMEFLMRHYKLNIGGPGVVTLQWAAGEDTEEQCACIVVAERTLLKKTLQQQPQLFRFPIGVSVEVAYEEPQRVPDSDQLTYLPPKCIQSRDLHSSRAGKSPLRLPHAAEGQRGKRTLQQATGRASHYRYTALSDLVNGNTDLYGVVVNASLPKKSGGKDYCMSIHVVDETCPHRSDAVPINIFYPSIDKMPKILYAGDIIRFHKLKIQQYRDNLQGVATANATRYLVLREGNDGQLETQTCSKTWTFEASDEQRTRELIKWARANLERDQSLPPGCPQPPLPLSELQRADHFIDVVARVVLVDNDSTPARLVLWDGTGDASTSDQRVVELAQTCGVALPAKGVAVELTMDSCWPVVQQMGFVQDKLLGDGHWCRFRNVAVTSSDVVTGPRGEVLRFREVSALMLAPDYSPEVKERLNISLQGPQSSPTAPVSTGVAPPTTGVRLVVPEYIQANVPVTPLAETTRVPRKYHCLARFTGISPSDLSMITRPKTADSTEFVYYFTVTIEDASGTLDAIVYGSDGDRFLHGIPACDLTKSASLKAVINKRLDALLRSPGLHHCCIKSYKPPRQPVDEPEVRYRLFDTRLQC